MLRTYTKAANFSDIIISCDNQFFTGVTNIFATLYVTNKKILVEYSII